MSAIPHALKKFSRKLIGNAWPKPQERGFLHQHLHHQLRVHWPHCFPCSPLLSLPQNLLFQIPLGDHPPAHFTADSGWSSRDRVTPPTAEAAPAPCPALTTKVVSPSGPGLGPLSPVPLPSSHLCAAGLPRGPCIPSTHLLVTTSLCPWPASTRPVAKACHLLHGSNPNCSAWFLTPRPASVHPLPSGLQPSGPWHARFPPRAGQAAPQLSSPGLLLCLSQTLSNP